MKLYTFQSFVNEALKSDVKLLLAQMLEMLENTASTFEYHYDAIGTRSTFDGNIFGGALDWNEEDEEKPAAIISSADNYEELPRSLTDRVALTFGNYGYQRLIVVEFDNFKQLIGYITKGGLEKMLNWYNSKNSNNHITYQFTELPDFLQV